MKEPRASTESETLATALTVDSIVDGSVLVFGSLPPEARDLDLLVRPHEHFQLTDTLPRLGFLQKGRTWAHFSGCSVTSLDLVAVSEWRLSSEEAEALFREALPIEGFEKLLRPSSVHAFLILARRVVQGGGHLDEKRRARLGELLRENPNAWDEAEVRAAAWSANRAVSLLKTTYKTSVPATKIRSAAAAAQRFELDASLPGAAYLKGWRSVASSTRNGGLVALSGLDGSGKSLQSEALEEVCNRLGMDAVVVWTRLSYNPSLNVIALPVKRFLLRAKGIMRRSKQPDVMLGNETVTANPSQEYRLEGKELRRQSPFMTQGWATIVALANSLTQRRAVRYHLRRRRTVICDRYVLDSVVHLRYRYGEERKFRWQACLIKALSPKPVASYFLDVPPEVALSRKAEQYSLDQLNRQARLYKATYQRLGVKRLDGERPAEDLCEEIAPEVWLRFP